MVGEPGDAIFYPFPTDQMDRLCDDKNKQEHLLKSGKMNQRFCPKFIEKLMGLFFGHSQSLKQRQRNSANKP
jgi:hypothetical protein